MKKNIKNAKAMKAYKQNLKKEQKQHPADFSKVDALVSTVADVLEQEANHHITTSVVRVDEDEEDSYTYEFNVGSFQRHPYPVCFPKFNMRCLQNEMLEDPDSEEVTATLKEMLTTLTTLALSECRNADDTDIENHIAATKVWFSNVLEDMLFKRISEDFAA